MSRRWMFATNEAIVGELDQLKDEIKEGLGVSISTRAEVMRSVVDRGLRAFREDLAARKTSGTKSSESSTTSGTKARTTTSKTKSVSAPSTPPAEAPGGTAAAAAASDSESASAGQQAATDVVPSGNAKKDAAKARELKRVLLDNVDVEMLNALVPDEDKVLNELNIGRGPITANPFDGSSLA